MSMSCYGMDFGRLQIFVMRSVRGTLRPMDTPKGPQWASKGLEPTSKFGGRSSSAPLRHLSITAHDKLDGLVRSPPPSNLRRILPLEVLDVGLGPVGLPSANLSCADRSHFGSSGRLSARTAASAQDARWPSHGCTHSLAVGRPT